MTEALTTTGHNHILPEAESALGVFEPALMATSGDIPRFVDSRDPFVQEAYQFVQSRLVQVMVEDPTIIGVAAFGSTTKGYAVADKSDLDLSVFVDADQLNLHYMPEKVTDGEVSVFSDWAAFVPAGNHLRSEYDKRLEKALKTGNTDPALKLDINAEAVPISHSYLRFVAGIEAAKASDEARYYQLREAHPADAIEAVADWATVSTNPEVLESIPGIRKIMEKAGVSSSYVDMMSVRNLVGTQQEGSTAELSQSRTRVFWDNRIGSSLPLRLFNMAITPGLQLYRRSFLEALATSDQPDIAWRYFCKRLRVFEDSEKHPRDTSRINYPNSLDEAIELYC